MMPVIDILKEGGDCATFWVSFHHLPIENQGKALEVAVDSLRPGGILVFLNRIRFFPKTYFIKNRPSKRCFFMKMKNLLI